MGRQPGPLELGLIMAREVWLDAAWSALDLFPPCRIEILGALTAFMAST